MRWTIYGADATTGAEQTFEVEAPDSTAAEERARSFGILVSHVYPVASPVVAHDEPAPAAVVPGYETPTHVPVTTPRPHGAAPAYREIQTGAGILSFLGGLCIAFGWIVIAVGLLAAIYIGQKGNETSPGSAFVPALVAFLGSLMYGISMIVAGTFLRMNASLALAVRDIARNSFR